MKLVSPPWTVDDEGKVLSIKENKLAWVEMSGTPVEPEVEEYKWVVTPNKYTIYNEEGTTLKTENKTLTEWECPATGDYVVQLHAQGGTGGNWMGQQVSQGSYSLVTYSIKQFTGGSGYAIKDANDTVGYGSGGRSGTGQYVFAADDRIYTEEGEEGQGPAIIIRRKLE